MKSGEFFAKQKPRIAIVTQRYGQDVNGGAEAHAAMIVRRLSAYCSVEVITTCAKDYKDWSCYYKPGETETDGIVIKRFNCEQRDARQSKAVIQSIKYSWPVLWRRKLYKLTGKWLPYNQTKKLNQLGDDWLKFQGPYSPDLKEFVVAAQSDYDVFIFCTSLYYTTAACLPMVAKKSILVPHLHHETTTFFPVYQHIFNAAQRVICNTQSELQLMYNIFPATRQKSDVIGVGVDVLAKSPISPIDPNNMSKYENIEFILYLGRVSPSKGCGDLFDFFSRYIESSQSKVRLLVAGGIDMPIPNHPQIDVLGFVSEQVKHFLLARAKLLVIPSLYESLSLVLLESFAHKVPVLVNEACAVLKDHILLSSGGGMFKNYVTFEKHINSMLKDDSLRQQQGLAGYDYVQQHYSWDVFDHQYINIIQLIIQNNIHEVSKDSSTTSTY